MLIKCVKLYPDAKMPVRASSGAVGYDVYAYHVVSKDTPREKVSELPFIIEPGESALIGSGITFAVPFPIDCQIRPRSGLASKFNIELSNSPGTLDPDYRGEAGILLRNRGTKPFTLEKGMRVAQLIFTHVEIMHFEEVEILPPSRRDVGGFGSTGVIDMALGDQEYLDEQAKWDRYFMRLAKSASFLSNCLRGAEKNSDGKYIKDSEGLYVGAARRFGAAIVQERNLIAQGCNMRNMECSEECGCVRERENIPSGTSNDQGCQHAEINAFQNHAKTGVALKDASIYVNAEPCNMCAKHILGCGISQVIVPEGIYPTNGLKTLLHYGIEIRTIKV